MKVVESLLNPSEEAVLRELQNIASDNGMRVFVKPRLSDVIQKGEQPTHYAGWRKDQLERWESLLSAVIACTNKLRAHFHRRGRCKAFSSKRRIASGRDGASSWLPIHESRAARGPGCRRTKIGWPFPVAGGPLFFRDITD